MDFLADLVDETLLEIAGYLDAADLKSLALAARKYRGVAQEVLHRTHARVSENNGRGLQLLHLVRTLVRRPDLAHKVRNLHLVIPSSRAPFTAADLKKCPDIHHQGRQLISALDTNTFEWEMKFGIGNPAAWVGLLLAIVPNLECLYLPNKGLSLAELRISPRRDYSTFRALFGRGSLSVVPGLRSLRNLQVDLEELEGDWLTLPKLQSMDVARVCDFPYYAKEHPTFGLKDLRLKLSTTPFLSIPPHLDDQLFFPFVQHLRNLTKLEVSFCNIRFTGDWREQLPDPDEDDIDNDDTDNDDIDEDGYGMYDDASRNYRWQERKHTVLHHACTGSFANLFNKIKPWASTLEHLDISWTHAQELSCLDYVEPMDTLKDFSRLKVLKVPREALSYVADSSRNRPLVDLLPSSLQRISIDCPDLEICSRFEDILDHKYHLPNLERIDLRTRSVRGDSYEALLSSPTWTLFQENGVQVDIHGDPEANTTGSNEGAEDMSSEEEFESDEQQEEDEDDEED